MLTEEIKNKTFAEELKLIYDEGMREFTRLCVVSAPDYFFLDCPASTTGKYHPLDELAFDGTILHTRKVFTVAYELCTGLDCQSKRDEILAACIIHDLRKRGVKGSGHTTRNHPSSAADLVEEVQKATQILSDESYRIIRNCVGYHYGPWSSGKWKKGLDKYTPEEMCVYISDYIASKRQVVVNYKR